MEFRTALSLDAAELLIGPMEIEAGSAPEGGRIEIEHDRNGCALVIGMHSNDLSTLRAMLNSYLGLVSAALRTAGIPEGHI